MHKLLTTSVAISLLAGCAVGPDYEPHYDEMPGQDAFMNAESELFSDGDVAGAIEVCIQYEAISTASVTS